MALGGCSLFEADHSYLQQPSCGKYPGSKTRRITMRRGSGGETSMLSCTICAVLLLLIRPYGLVIRLNQ